MMTESLCDDPSDHYVTTRQIRYGRGMKKLPVALGLSAMIVLAGCSSSSSGGNTASSTPPSTTPTTAASTPAPAPTGAAGVALIKTNWGTFFKSATPHSTAVGLLQSGSTLGPAVKDAAKIAAAGHTKEAAKVTKVTFNPDGTTAQVTYTLYGNGAPLLKNSIGTAVYEDGQWKVSKITFCTLVDLGASSIGLKKVPGC
jgi:hypothetical protein